jgi:hypothetical protein
MDTAKGVKTPLESGTEFHQRLEGEDKFDKLLNEEMTESLNYTTTAT